MSPRNSHNHKLLTARAAAHLSDDLDRHLLAYVAAATAAGVGALALAQPAEAKIVYTPAHKMVQINHALPLDLNHDGIDDFDVFNLTHNSTTPFGDYLKAEPLRAGNKILVQQTSQGYGATALAAGIQVGPPAKQFKAGRDLMAFRSTSNGPSSGGPWKNVKGRYLGLKFVIKGKVHYGWARFNVTITDQVNATLTGYAYETAPDKPIVTGKTKSDVTLGTLANGR
jgi:hypothetical protein